MKHVRLSLSVLVVLVLVMVFVGCAKPPGAEKQAAKGAMDYAISAGADKYAATDIDAAKKVWDKAESQMNEKKYKEAKQSYIDAKAAFEKAAEAIEAGKKVADEANATILALQEAWRNLEFTARKMEKKMEGKKKVWTVDAKTFNEGLGKAKEMIAIDPARAKDVLGELKAMVDKWDKTFKEMAAAPAKPEAPKKGKK
jgi:hypothetical protein